MFEGGPVPINPVERPVSDDDLLHPDYEPINWRDDREWLDLVRCGGAGVLPETKQRQLSRYLTPSWPLGLEVSPDQAKYRLREPDLLVTCGIDYLVKTWDPNNNFQNVQTFEGHINYVNCVEIYRGSQLLTGSEDMTIRLWNLGTEPEGELALTIYTSATPVKIVKPLPGQRAAVGALDKILRIYSLKSGFLLHRLAEAGNIGPDDNFMQTEGCGAIYALLHLRGNILVSGGDDSTCRVWDIDRGKLLSTMIGHKGYKKDIGPVGIGWKLSEEFAPVWRIIGLADGGMKFASCSYDRTISIWDSTEVDDLKVIRNWKAHDNAVLSIGLCGKHHIASCGADKEARVWNYDTMECVCRIPTRGMATDVCMLNATTIAIAGGDSTVRVHDWVNGIALAGPYGFNAHDSSLSWITGYFRGDEDLDHWCKDAIMYQTCSLGQGEKDAEQAIKLLQKALADALEYQDTSKGYF